MTEKTITISKPDFEKLAETVFCLEDLTTLIAFNTDMQDSLPPLNNTNALLKAWDKYRELNSLGSTLTHLISEAGKLTDSLIEVANHD